MNGMNEDTTEAVYASLEGLSVGDAFGERFFVSSDIVDHLIQNRAIPRGEWRYMDADADHPTWRYTDDTEMALSIVWALNRFGVVHQDELARSFARNYDRSRGYGPAMHQALGRIGEGADWRDVSQSLFGGQGSFGNGAAMRVAPLGAYFADDLEMAVDQAKLSAEVTHTHLEGIAGAIAVAVAAAFATRSRGKALPKPQEFLDQVLSLVPDSAVREKIRHARNLGPNASADLAVSALGNGIGISAQDTVPFALWCASLHLDDYEEALWLTVGGLGDRDTTCAIVGGIVASRTSFEGIPGEWRRNREPLPDWPFQTS